MHAFLKSPTFQIISFLFGLIGLVGVIFSVYAYKNSYQPIRAVTFSITPPIQIFDNDSLGDSFKLVSKSKNTEIEGDLYNALISIENTGNLPIDAEHVRKAFEVLVKGEILDHSINSDSETNAHLIEGRNGISISVGEIPVEVLTLGWDHLDPGKEIQMNIVYIPNDKVTEVPRINDMIVDFEALNLEFYRRHYLEL